MSNIQIEIIPESIKLLKIDDNTYFSSEYKEYISNSKLSLINPDEEGSIEKYKSGFKSSFSDSFEAGSAVHGIILQPEYYALSQIMKPSGKLGLFADKAFFYLKESEEWTNLEILKLASKESDYYSDKLTQKRIDSALESCIPYWKKRKEQELIKSEKDLIYLSQNNYNKSLACINSINSNKKIIEVLRLDSFFNDVEIYNEYAIIAEVIVTIDEKTVRLKLKAKLDNFTINHTTQEITLNDLKTTGKPVGFFMGNNVYVEGGNKVWYDGSFQKFHYYRQMAMYGMLMSCWHKHQGFNYKVKANMLVVETIPEYKSKIYPVYNKHIQKGLLEFKNLITIVANEALNN